MHFPDVLAVTRFDRADDVHCGNIGASEGTLMLHVFYARARIGQHTRELCQAAGAITDNDAETRQTAIPNHREIRRRASPPSSIPTDPKRPSSGALWTGARCHGLIRAR